MFTYICAHTHSCESMYPHYLYEHFTHEHLRKTKLIDFKIDKVTIDILLLKGTLPTIEKIKKSKIRVNIFKADLCALCPMHGLNFDYDD